MNGTQWCWAPLFLFLPAGAQGLHNERGAAQIEHRVLHRHLRGQTGARRARAEGERRHGQGDVRLGDENLLGQQPLFFAHHDGEAAEQGRRDIVGVTVDRGGQLEHARPVERPAQQRVGAEQPGDRGGGTRTEAGRRRDAHVAVDGEAGRRSGAGLLVQPQKGTRDQIGFVCRQRLAVLAGHRDPHAVALQGEPHVVPQVERHAETIKAGAQVGRCRGHPHAAAGAGRQERPSASGGGPGARCRRHLTTP